MKHTSAVIALTFALSALLASASHSAPKAGAKVDTTAARQKCIADAVAAVPQTPGRQETEVMTERTDKYRACAQRMGFRP